MSEFEVHAVPVDLIDMVWNDKIDLIRRGLTKAMGDTTTEQEMLDDLKAGRTQLWSVSSDDNIDAVLVISIDQFTESKKVVVSMVAGSRFPEWADTIEPLLLTLKDICDADSIEIACRLGSAKILANRGWHKKAIIMELR